MFVEGLLDRRTLGGVRNLRKNYGVRGVINTVVLSFPRLIGPSDEPLTAFSGESFESRITTRSPIGHHFMRPSVQSSRMSCG